ncbi:MAG: patatin-like phospholipase family protein [Clostridia bacterium]|nr:patatin-like phospholipase family protein [Clostridia bacterium]
MKLGIALSGGGIRGIAHAGVLQALEENGIKPDIIGGTSCGSIIAAMYALGYSPYHIFILCKRYGKIIAKANAMPILNGIQNSIIHKKMAFLGLNNGEKMEEIGNEMALKRGIEKIKEIKMPLVIPTVDLVSGKEYIFTNNIPRKKSKDKEYIDDANVGRAIRASSSFPAYFSPCKHNGCAFMDGGVLNNVPADEVKLQGADKVIAVKFHSDEIKEDSNLMDVAMKCIDIMGNKLSEKSLNMSDYILDVYTDKIGLLDYQKVDKCYEYGYKSVIDNLDEIKKCLSNS